MRPIPPHQLCTLGQRLWKEKGGRKRDDKKEKKNPNRNEKERERDKEKNMDDRKNANWNWQNKHASKLFTTVVAMK